MRAIRTSGSLGASGEQSPEATRPPGLVCRGSFWAKNDAISPCFLTISGNRGTSDKNARKRPAPACLPLFRQGAPNAQRHWKIGQFVPLARSLSVYFYIDLTGSVDGGG